jgi:hypothetical protein
VRRILQSTPKRETPRSLKVVIHDLLAVTERGGNGHELLDEFVDEVTSDAVLISEGHRFGKKFDDLLRCEEKAGERERGKRNSQSRFDIDEIMEEKEESMSEWEEQ